MSPLIRMLELNNVVRLSENGLDTILKVNKNLIFIEFNLIGNCEYQFYS